MTNNSFFTSFLKISTTQTLLAVVLLIVAVVLMNLFKKKKVKFSSRMLIGLLFGLIIGIGIELIFRNNEIYTSVSRTEIGLWYSLLGSTFVRLIQLMAIPVVFFSIFFVILDFQGKNLGKFTAKSLLLLLGTTAIAALVGILVTNLFGLKNSNFTSAISDTKADQISQLSSQSFPQFALNLVPNNIVGTFSSNSAIVSTVIISILFGKFLYIS